MGYPATGHVTDIDFPATTFIASIFMLDLSMATKGGIHLYYLLTTYYTLSW